MSEGSFIIVHISEAHIVLIIVHSCHDLNAARTAERHGIHIGICNALTRKSVDVRGFVFRTSITTEALGSDIISEEEHNVRLLLLNWSTGSCGGHH